MNPQNNPTNQANASGNGLSLPPVEPNPAPAHQPVVPPVPVPQAAPLANPAPVATPAVNQTHPTNASPVADADSPMIADDADLIEKAWVEKAKQLVEQTKDDPYKQNKEINKFKADYIKKRYNKDIQLSKD